MTSKWDVWKDFLRTTSTLTNELETTLKNHAGISLSEFDILATIRQAPNPPTINCLKANLVLTTSGLSRAVTRLVEKNLITKTTNPDDKRASFVTLTAKGEELFRTLGPAHDNFVAAAFFNRFSREELTTFADYIARLHPQ